MKTKLSFIVTIICFCVFLSAVAIAQNADLSRNTYLNQSQTPISFESGYRRVNEPIIYDVAEDNIDGDLSNMTDNNLTTPNYKFITVNDSVVQKANRIRFTDSNVTGGNAVANRNIQAGLFGNGVSVCEPVTCDPVCEPMMEAVDCCEPVCVVPWYSRVQFYGWLQGGLYANAHGSTTERYHGINRAGKNDLLQDLPSGNGSTLGNVRQTGAVLNQLWFGLKRDLDTSLGFDWGFRGEFLFGTDARLVQSYGDATFDYWSLRRDYSIAIPQLYVSFGYRNLSVKIGKFESLLGYEHIQAVDSPFYSHSNLFYAEPQSHSGVLFDYNINPDFWVSLGYVQGSDSTLSNRFGDNGLIGGIYWRCCPSMTFWYTLYYANRGSGVFANGEPHPDGDEFRHTLVMNWKLTSRFDYVFQWDLGSRRISPGNSDNASYFGWAQYFTYRIHSRLKCGIRIDQLHSQKLMANSGFARPNTFINDFKGDLFGITIGAEWTPYRNFSFKPEIRFDYSDTKNTFGGGHKRDQISFGFGIVYEI
ncbi:MAG: porin [Planctomycetaceae bacterium]|nr:porin [Planctomycetaceae bacterium]